jgi:toxin FitB
MNVVDSSAWLEYFADGPDAGFFAPAIEKTTELLVPSLTLHEVFNRVFQRRDEGAALQAVAVMQQGAVLRTQDADFKGIAGVEYRKQRPRPDAG